MALDLKVNASRKPHLRLWRWTSMVALGGLVFGGCASTTPTATPSAVVIAPVATSTADGAPALNPAPEALPNVEAGQIYTATNQLFSVPIPTNWQVREENAIVHLTDSDGKIKMDLLTIENPDLKAAIGEAWSKVDPAFTLEPVSVEEPPSTQGVEQTMLAFYDDGDSSHGIAAMAQRYDGIAYILLMEADTQAMEKRGAQMGIIQSGFKILALDSTTLQGTPAQPITAAITTELEAFIERQLAQSAIPGVNVAIVQDGSVVYAKGFGVRDRTSGAPMTPDTHMLIGSTGKSLTTMLMATLVDDGLMTWDTPVVDILPTFRVKDAELSKQLTVRNLVCACTGVPRRDLEWLLNADSLSPEAVVESLAIFEFFTEFGEAFQYSNQMVATGGYVAGVAAGGNPEALGGGYEAALQQRVLDPIGMTNTTLSFEEVQASANYATPHGLSFANESIYQPIPLKTEQLLLPMAPAGAHWSTTNDMAKYLITQLNHGLSPQGVQVVSAENLDVTREPQIPVDATTHYGLGWFVGSYHDLPLIAHGGNTFGFTSDFAFLPEQGLGIIVMTNAQGTNAFNESIRTRLFELVFNQEPAAEQLFDFAMEQQTKQLADFSNQITETLDLTALTPFLGSYEHPDLGSITLMMEEDRLVLDVGEFQSVVKAKVDQDGVADGYILIDGPGSGTPFNLQQNSAGEPEFVLETGLSNYTFDRTP